MNSTKTLAAAFVAVALHAQALTKTLEFDNAPEAQRAPAGAQAEARPRPEQEGARLRCWQHGVLILEEPLREAPPHSRATWLTGVTAGGRPLSLHGTETSLCLVISPGLAAGFVSGR